MVNLKLIFYIALLLNINLSLGAIELDIFDKDDLKNVLTKIKIMQMIALQ